MLKTMSRMMAAVAALGLVVTPVMAQANTRAGDNGTVYNVSAPGLGRDDEGEDFAGIAPLALVIAVVTATVTAIITAAEQVDNDDGQSPGT